MSEPTPSIDKVKSLNFDRLDDLVSERIGALKIMAQNLDKLNADTRLTEMMCRDLILPAVYTLTEFLSTVEVNNED